MTFIWFLHRQNNQITRLQFLLDTGASVSLIKANKLNQESVINTNDQISISGISAKSIVSTMGSTFLDVFSEDELFQLKVL